jgi:hypothetical protein
MGWIACSSRHQAISAMAGSLILYFREYASQCGSRGKPSLPSLRMDEPFNEGSSAFLAVREILTCTLSSSLNPEITMIL